MSRKYKINKVMEKFKKEKQSKKVYSYLDYRLDKNVESFNIERLPYLLKGSNYSINKIMSG